MTQLGPGPQIPPGHQRGCVASGDGEALVKLTWGLGLDGLPALAV